MKSPAKEGLFDGGIDFGMYAKPFVDKQTDKQTIGWLVVLRFNATLTAKVISWQSVMHMCLLAFLHQY